MIRAACLATAVLCAAAARAEDLKVLAPGDLPGPPGKMVHAHLMRLAHAALDRRTAEYEKLKTPDDIAAYQQRRREFFLAALGGLPERTPLNARVVGREQCDGYRVEKVIYESQPRHYVTALMYLPQTPPPFPGVLVPCGHSDNGKAAEAYQRVCILLARNGLAALCYDPIDQGERMQLLDGAGKPQARGTVGHCLVGVGSILLGRNTATFRIWDGMRGIDYLQSRPDIDPKRIGCTGNSGGGTLTSYLMALDERIVCAAPSCYLCGFRRLLETIGPQDAEQDIHGQIAFGLDHADYVLMRAPRPTLLCTATGDYFDIGGAWDLFRQAKRVYTRLGVPQNVELAEADEKHGFSPPLRIAAVAWQRRWLLKIDEPLVEPPATIFTDPQAQVTPGGQVMLLDNARSVYDINRDVENQLAAARRKFWGENPRDRCLDEVRKLTGIRQLGDLPPVKAANKGTLARDGYRIEKLVLEGEQGVWLPALAFVPEKPGKDATLYLHADGKQAGAAPGGPIEKLVRQGCVVLAVDLRGCGETQLAGGGGYAKFLGPEWADGFLAYMLNTSYLAMRAEDILRAARFLQGYESAKPRPVHLVSHGRVGPPALHAVALEPARFASAEFHRSLAAWSEVVTTPMAVNQFVNVVHGALRAYDLPDLLATLPPEKSRVIEPLDALESPLAGPK